MIYRGCIDRFTGDHLFLSNYYPGRVTFKGYSFTTAEHAYQCQKIPQLLWGKINNLQLPANAKRTVKTMLRDPARGFEWNQAAWDMTKIDVMRSVLKAKFGNNWFLRDMLDDTAPCELIEGNTWKDRFWGVPLDNHGARTGIGENWLGRLLMELRDAPRS